MKIGAAGSGYTPGSIYKRSASAGYTPGSLYQRFGSSGLLQSRNMGTMNRQAAESVNGAFQTAGPQVFEASATEGYGRSELAADQVLKRAQAVMNALASAGESVSAANGGTGSAVDETV